MNVDGQKKVFLQLESREMLYSSLLSKKRATIQKKKIVEK